MTDERDACPDAAGVPPDGCPIPDSDGDGILDPIDQCVTEPELHQGYQDCDGCPEELPPGFDQLSGELGDVFVEGTSTIKPEALAQLDGLTAALRQFGSTRIVITGRATEAASGEGSSRSLARADAIRQRLVAAGIGADRIEARASGPEQPGRVGAPQIQFQPLAERCVAQ